MKRHSDPQPNEPLGATCGDPDCTIPHIRSPRLASYLPPLPEDQVCPMCGDTGHPVASCLERNRPDVEKEWWRR